MDIRQLPVSANLSTEAIHTWLNQSWPIIRMGTLNIQRALMEAYAQKPIEDTDPKNVKQLAAELAAWGTKHKMWTSHPHGGKTFSLNGVAFIQASLDQRKSPKKAWDEMSGAWARIQWLNNAPEHLFPLQVSDVLLFGSMTRPDSTDHGDCDGVMVYQPKSDTSLRKAQKLFHSPPFQWARPVAGYASYRFVMDKTINDGDKFCRLTSDGKTLDVLYEHDNNFSLVSLNNRAWSTDLYHTQLDEVFDVVQAAQNNTPMEHMAHVFSSLRAAQRRYGGTSLEHCAQNEVLPLLQQFPKDTHQQNFVAWWACLGGATVLSGLLQQLDTDTAHKWNTVIEEIPCVAAVWDEAQNLKTDRKIAL